MPGDPGEIRGEDGKVYRYQQSQVRADDIFRAGQRVDFISLGEEARDIYPVEGRTPDAATAAPLPAAPPVMAPPPPAYTSIIKPPANPAAGAWTYFTGSLTRKYARFHGRARRAEYWSYTLFWWLFTVAALIVDGFILAVTEAERTAGFPFWFFYISILWQLGTLVPNIAIVVRRLHDLNMSGWFYLIKAADFIFPYLGTIVIFIFTLMDSKPEPNRHGASPKYDQDRDVATVFS